ncbi:MAG: alkaline phosphatase D family protein [Armatimonadetes bacterium]|nr:alkaline phosphatase D family protein [Armatimonadota bacterium]
MLYTAGVAFPRVFSTSWATPRLRIPYGVQSGEVTPGGAVVWAASDRPARMVVEWSTTDRFRDVQRIVGPWATPDSGFTAKVWIPDLPPGSDIFYRVFFEDPSDPAARSEPMMGHLRTPPQDTRTVRFLWSGDTAGQGWGVNPEWGGMRIYETMRRLQPDFFVHCGDMIYADNPLLPAVALPDGSVWRNVVTPEKAKVAETLEEFRGNYRYNLLDANVRRFHAEVPVYVLWDDHEVTNNWYWERVLHEDARYTVKDVRTLAVRAKRAMWEFTPLRGPRVYRKISYGPHLDLFLLDMRTYRGPNGENRQLVLEPGARILGSEQVRWLKRELLRSRATWKVIAADMPLGLIVYHDAGRRWGSEAVAQGSGPPMGRELEIAEVLAFLKQHGIQNTVWITADVHYCATHHYHPDRAQFRDFLPFYEFVSGPLHAGGFGPNALDDTFGPAVVFQKHPPTPNTPPTAGYLFFGEAVIDGRSGVLTVRHRDVSGAVLHELMLEPRR